MGWGEELALISHASRRPENLSLVRKACSRTLTEQGMVSLKYCPKRLVNNLSRNTALSNLEAPLIQYMVQVQKVRLINARWHTLPQRLKVLKDFHGNRAVAWNCIYPTTAELFRIPAVRNLIDSAPNTSAFTLHNLAPIHRDMPILMRWWRQDMELKLIDLICGEHSNREAIDREYMFNLATSFFSCSKCSRFLRYPKVVVHACATLPFLRRDSDLDTVILTNTLRESFWNLSGCITVNVAHVALLVRLLDMAHLTWATTTIQELDTRDPIFECISCNDARMGRATMTWAQVVRL